MGGGSPLLAQTEAQADALQAALEAVGGDGEVRVFVAMRYWHPLIAEVALEVAAFAPDEVVLLPLYPQFSTTTTASSLAEWGAAAARAGIAASTRAVCCYPVEPAWVAAQAAAIGPAWRAAAAAGQPRVLFSAHGLPKRTLARGDPYAWQVEQTAAAIAAEVGVAGGERIDGVVCYQSKVGPLEWIGPATGDEIRRAGTAGRPVVVVPIAFVSEHAETLVELDGLYRRVAAAAGVPAYHRVPAVGTAPLFIECLAGLVRAVRAGVAGTVRAAGGQRLCPHGYGRCAMA